MSFEKKVATFFFAMLFLLPVYFYVQKKNAVQEIALPTPRAELTITVIPGWDLRQVADYFVKMGFASTTEDVFKITGRPASTETKAFEYGNSFLVGLKKGLSLEGYLAPETYRVYEDAVLGDVIKKLVDQREKEFNTTGATVQNWHEILSMASLIEDEARTPEDRRLVSDILWRRLKRGWALQLDSTVHYAVDKTGTVFTTDRERDSASPWNTYKYPGLPPGPICNPSFDSIEAALNPKPNSYWYFLSGTDGKMYYATTLEEHTANRYKYLR